MEALRAGLPRGRACSAGRRTTADNPYLGLLGLADGFVVTGDSVSMMVEVVRAAQAARRFSSCRSAGSARIDQLRRSLARRLFHPDSGRVRRLIATGAGATHVLDATRDFRAFHQMLIDSGLAVRAGEPLLPPRGAVPDDMPAVVTRIRALMGATLDRASG